LLGVEALGEEGGRGEEAQVKIPRVDRNRGEDMDEDEIESRRGRGRIAEVGLER